MVSLFLASLDPQGGTFDLCPIRGPPARRGLSQGAGMMATRSSKNGCEPSLLHPRALHASLSSGAAVHPGGPFVAAPPADPPGLVMGPGGDLVRPLGVPGRMPLRGKAGEPGGEVVQSWDHGPPGTGRASMAPVAAAYGGQPIPPAAFADPPCLGMGPWGDVLACQS